MKTIVVGDLHGKHEIIDSVMEKFGNTHNIIFIGDYLDSHTRNTEDCITCLNKIYDAACKKNVTALMGNHELSYIDPNMRASGFDLAVYAQINEPHMRKMLKDFVWVGENVFVSHAGVSAKGRSRFTEDMTVQEFKNCVRSDRGMLEKDLYQDVGKSRGGTSESGGIFWCDFWQELTSFDNVIQVVGHTSKRLDINGIVVFDNTINVDCLDNTMEVLEIDTSKEQPTFNILEL